MEIKKNKDGEIIEIKLWHIINGKYVNIVQIFENGKMKYFTDGKEENNIKV